MILAVDGCDGAGKTTVADLLHDYLYIDRKLPVKKIVMPGATALGQELRRIVKSESYKPAPIVERLIFAADTMQFEAEHREFIENGGWLVCDRFARITDLIYAQASGVDIQNVINIQNAIKMKLNANLYFPFQLPLEVALERKESRGSLTIKEKCRIEEKGKSFLEKVNEAYCSLQPKGVTPCSSLQLFVEQRCGEIIPVNAARTAKEAFDDIKVHVEVALKGIGK